MTNSFEIQFNSENIFYSATITALDNNDHTYFSISYYEKNALKNEKIKMIEVRKNDKCDSYDENEWEQMPGTFKSIPNNFINVIGEKINDHYDHLFASTTKNIL